MIPSEPIEGVIYWTYKPGIQLRWEEWQTATAATEAKHTDTLQATITAMSAQHREEVEALRDRCVMLNDMRLSWTHSLEKGIRRCKDCGDSGDSETLNDILQYLFSADNPSDIKAWKNEQRAEALEEFSRMDGIKNTPLEYQLCQRAAQLRSK